MVPHLVRAWSTYNAIRIRSFDYTHTTNTYVTGDGLVEEEQNPRKFLVINKSLIINIT